MRSGPGGAGGARGDGTVAPPVFSHILLARIRHDHTDPRALDWLPGGGVPGGTGQAVRFRASGAFASPFALLALAAELEPSPLGGAKA